MRALPFGAVRSVHSFLRFAHSLWFLLVTEFLILTTGYFDDFLVLAIAVEAPAVTSCMQLFLRMLGWAFAETGSKAKGLGTLFQALGVEIFVGSLHTGLVTVNNTESRPRASRRYFSLEDCLRLRLCGCVADCSSLLGTCLVE